MASVALHAAVPKFTCRGQPEILIASSDGCDPSDRFRATGRMNDDVAAARIRPSMRDSLGRVIYEKRDGLAWLLTGTSTSAAGSMATIRCQSRCRDGTTASMATGSEK